MALGQQPRDGRPSEGASQAERHRGAEHRSNPGNHRAPQRSVDHPVRKRDDLGRKRQKRMKDHEAYRCGNAPWATTGSAPPRPRPIPRRRTKQATMPARRAQLRRAQEAQRARACLNFSRCSARDVHGIWHRYCAGARGCSLTGLRNDHRLAAQRMQWHRLAVLGDRCAKWDFDGEHV